MKMGSITGFIEKNLFIAPTIQKRIFQTLLIILIVTFIYLLLKKLLRNTIKKATVYYKVKKTVLYTLVIIALILIGRAWFEGIQSFVTFMGLFSAALAIVMKDVILNIAGWIYIITKSPFEVGDRIEVNDIAGDVIDIQLLNFKILEIGNWIYGDKYSGRVVHIQNSNVFGHSIANYNKGTPYIWSEFLVSVFVDSNWEKAKEIIQKAAEETTNDLIPKAKQQIKRAPKSYSPLIEGLKAKVYTKINDETADVTFTVRYITHYKNRRGTAQQIHERILKEFKKHDDIQIGVPFQIVKFDEYTEYQIKERKPTQKLNE